MPNIKRLFIGRTHLTSHAIRLITIVRPCFLITENLVILCGTLRKDFLIKNSLLADIGEDRPIVVKTRLTRPMTLNALLISMIITGNHNTDNIAVLGKRLHKIVIGVRSLRHTNNSTLRSIGTGTGTGLLNDLIYIDRNTVTTEILGTL